MCRRLIASQVTKILTQSRAPKRSRRAKVCPRQLCDGKQRKLGTFIAPPPSLLLPAHAAKCIHHVGACPRDRKRNQVRDRGKLFRSTAMSNSSAANKFRMWWAKRRGDKTWHRRGAKLAKCPIALPPFLSLSRGICNSHGHVTNTRASIQCAGSHKQLWQKGGNSRRDLEKLDIRKIYEI